MIIGVDEVGYGSIAGPVAAGAVVYKQDWDLVEVKDSKKLTENQRNKAFDGFINDVVFWVVVYGRVEDINRHGVGKIRFQTLARAVQIARERAGFFRVIVDGNILLPDTPEQILVPKADELYPIVSAASITAKVIRDRYMRIAGDIYRGYNFEQNKGYGTSEHVEAIRKHGPCVLHRTGYRLFQNLQN